MVIRLVDAGTVSHLRSQTIYHGLAYARTKATPDTIVLATPGEPYVCIGYHQDLDREIDVEYCRQRGLPVLRRETGGGAVYLDRDQLFVQWVMGASRLPSRIDKRFELFAQPLVATYRALGIEAEFCPKNDIHVGGRKIVGTGAARIGSAEVLVGNFIFDFDTGVMARVLRAPSRSFRDQVDRSLREYMTSMQRELGQVPDREKVATLYCQECEEALGVELEPGELTKEEIRVIGKVDRRFRSESFLRPDAPGLDRTPRRSVKIREGVRVVEAVQRDNGDLLRVSARIGEGRIEEISLTRDPSRGEEGGLVGLEEALRGVELGTDSLTQAMRAYDEAAAVGLRLTGWLQAVLNLEGQDTNDDRRP